MDSINYRRVYHRLKRRYPFILKQIDAPNVLPSVADLPRLYAAYVKLQLNPDITLTKCDPKLRFCAVIVLMTDPNFFDDDAPVQKGLATALGQTLGCDRTVISHSLKTVKNYKRLYPKFWEEVQYFYRLMLE